MRTLLLVCVAVALVSSEECHVILRKDPNGTVYRVGDVTVRSGADAANLIEKWIIDNHTGNTATVSTLDTDCASACIDLGADLMSLDKPIYASIYLEKNGQRTDLS